MSATHDTILIVDDIPTNLQVLFDYLRGAGFKVWVAEDGPSAIQQVAYAKPDIILLDVIMPGLDGFETCRRLKANRETKEIPVIFMTALSDTVDKVKGFELGAVDYITKPLQHEEVLARITTHLTIRHLQQSLREQISERDKLIAELDAFAHTVAHDLRGPVGIITNYIDLFQAEWHTMSGTERDESLQAISRLGNKALNIIEELLLLASVRNGKAHLAPLNMAEIVAEVEQRLAYMITEHRAKIIGPAQWPTALGYAPWVEEVWANYLSNAIKYGGRPPQVKLGATIQEDGMVRFWVHDNGPGLEPTEQQRLFTPFTRLNQVRAEGHGLGLSIVQRVVDKLGGQVAIESQGIPGQGSTFSFTLPVYNNSN